MGGSPSALSPEYMWVASASYRRLLRQAMPVANLRLAQRRGRSIDARTAIMAITTSSSMRVKAFPRSKCRRHVGAGRGMRDAVCIRMMSVQSLGSSWIQAIARLGAMRTRCHRA